MTRPRAVLPLLGLVLLAPTCAGNGKAPDETRRPLVAVIPKGSSHEFWKAVHAGALKAGRELGADILWQGPLKEDDREEQIRVVDMVRARGVSGIALAPLDDKALRIPVADAITAGIPVVVFDSDLATHDYVSFISTDNYQGGRTAGEHLAALLGGRGPVMMLRLHEGSESTTKREQGFLDVMAGHPGITVVSSNQYGGASTESAYKASENLLTATRATSGHVAGIFTPNESTTFGMLRALQNAKLAGRIRFVGFDASDRLVDAMRAGEIDGLVVQDPMAMGYLSVKTLMAHLRGEKVEKRIGTGALLVTRENLEQPAVRERVKPNLDILRD
jgi:ribose transport system substrate-binding protein